MSHTEKNDQGQLDRLFTKYLKIDAPSRILLRLSHRDHITQGELDSFLSSYNIDTMPFDFAFLLSRLMRKHPYLTYTADVSRLLPRLEGVNRFLHYLNVSKLQAFREVALAMEKAGISIIIMKGLAMKYREPDNVRLMWDLDFLVPAGSFNLAVQVMLNLGYTIKGVAQRSVEFDKWPASIDVHHRLFHELGTQEPPPLPLDMIFRAQEVTAFGMNCKILAKEDHLLLVLENIYFDHVIHPGYSNNVYHLHEALRLVRQWGTQLDWTMLLSTAVHAGIRHRIAVALELLEWLQPGVLPARLIALLVRDRRLTAKLKLDLMQGGIQKMNHQGYVVLLNAGGSQKLSSAERNKRRLIKARRDIMDFLRNRPVPRAIVLRYDRVFALAMRLTR